MDWRPPEHEILGDSQLISGVVVDEFAEICWFDRVCAPRSHCCHFDAFGEGLGSVNFLVVDPLFVFDFVVIGLN